MRRLRFAVLLSSVAFVAVSTSAQAAPVIVGSPLVGPFKEEGPAGAGLTATAVNLTLGESGAHATSPVNGAIVAWHLLDAKGGPFRLRVMRPDGGPIYTAVASSAPVTAAGGVFESFVTDLPVRAGDTVGLDLSEGISLGLYLSGPTSSVAIWGPVIAEGETSAYAQAQAGGEYGFNAEVQPTPTITSLGATSGPTGGGTSVTIAGTDFEGASAVRFGSSPAVSYSVDSEGQITAVSPAGSSGSVQVTVTTVAGTATSAQQFAYQAPPTPTPILAPTCTVPKLKGKNLKSSKKKIKAADCKVGKVTKRKGAKAKSGKVVGQSKKPGTVLPAGTVVKVTLGKG
jgi:IPT/TIG domain/PASTA domain